MAVLDIQNSSRAYSDTSGNSNPSLRNFDWDHVSLGIQVTRPMSREYWIDPNATLSIFSGQRTTSIDGTTAFTVTLSPLSGSRYRVTKTAGTSPAFRTTRSINMTNNVMTFTVIANGTLQVSLGAGGLSGTDFSLVQVGDNVWIPGVATGDVGGPPFNTNNQGLWSVLAVSPVSATANRLLTLVRVNSSDSTGAAESVTPTASSQFLAFSAAGVQAGDNIEFVTNWSQALKKTFFADLVTPDWFEFLSTSPLPLDVGILPTNSGLVFYTDAKRFLRIEVDQEAAIQLNGDSTQLNRIAPLSPGDIKQVGWLEKFGTVWSLSIVNRTAQILKATVFSAD